MYFPSHSVALKSYLRFSHGARVQVLHSRRVSRHISCLHCFPLFLQRLVLQKCFCEILKKPLLNKSVTPSKLTKATELQKLKCYSLSKPYVYCSEKWLTEVEIGLILCKLVLAQRFCKSYLAHLFLWLLEHRFIHLKSSFKIATLNNFICRQKNSTL